MIRSVDHNLRISLLGWNVDRVQLQRDQYIVHASSIRNPSACPDCGGWLYSHGLRDQQLRDVPYDGRPVVIQITRRRYRCRDCGRTILQPLPGVGERGRLTLRLVGYIQRAARSRSYISVARETGVTEKTVRLLAPN